MGSPWLSPLTKWFHTAPVTVVSEGSASQGPTPDTVADMNTEPGPVQPNDFARATGDSEQNLHPIELASAVLPPQQKEQEQQQQRQRDTTAHEHDDSAQEKTYPIHPFKIASLVKDAFSSSSTEGIQQKQTFADIDPSVIVGNPSIRTATAFPLAATETEHVQHPLQGSQHEVGELPQEDPVSPEPQEDEVLQKQKISLRSVVRAIEWMLSSAKSSNASRPPDSDLPAGNTDKGDDSDMDTYSQDNNNNRWSKTKGRKQRKQQSAAPPPPPPPRPTISRTRLKVFVGTWNMMGQLPDIKDGLTGFLDVKDPAQPKDISHEGAAGGPGGRSSPSTATAPLSHNISPSLSAPDMYAPPKSAEPKGEHDPEFIKCRLFGRLWPLIRDNASPRNLNSSPAVGNVPLQHYTSAPVLTSTPLPPPPTALPGILKDPFLEMNKGAPYHIIAINTQECEREIREAVLFPSKTAWEKYLQASLGPDYVMIKTETMAALHMAVFIWRPIEDLVSAVDSSTVATGIGGIVGNKGAVAISVYLGSTSFLFVNAHLTAHQGNTHARNSDYKRIIHELQLNDAPKSSPGLWYFKGDMRLRRHYNSPSPFGLVPQKAVLFGNNGKVNGDKLNGKSFSAEGGLTKKSSHNGGHVELTSTATVAASTVTSETAADQIHGGVHGHGNEPGSKGSGESATQAHAHAQVLATAANVDITEQFDYTFWAGDLNYRVDLTRAEAEEYLQKGDLDIMLAHDQLTHQRNAGAVFDGFMEAPIRFKPTYKFDPVTPLSDYRLRRNRQKTLMRRPKSMMNISMESPSPSLVPTAKRPIYYLENNKSCPSLLLGANKGDVGPIPWKASQESRTSSKDKVKKRDKTNTKEKKSNGEGGSGSGSGSGSCSASVREGGSALPSDAEPGELSDSSSDDHHHHKGPSRVLSVSKAIKSVRRRQSIFLDQLSPKRGQHQHHTRRHSGDLLVHVLNPKAKIGDATFYGDDSFISSPVPLRSDRTSEGQGQFSSSLLSPELSQDPNRIQQQQHQQQQDPHFLQSPSTPPKSTLNPSSPLSLDDPPTSIHRSPRPSVANEDDDWSWSLEHERERDRQSMLQRVRYDTSSKQRVPSWTDRILWKSTGGNYYLPSEIGDDTRSNVGGSRDRGGGRKRGWSLLKMNRTKILSGQATTSPQDEEEPEDGRTNQTTITTTTMAKSIALDVDSGPRPGSTPLSKRRRSKDSGATDGKKSLLESFRMDFYHSRPKQKRDRERERERESMEQSLTMTRPLLSEEDEDRAAVIVKDYAAHHEVGLFSDHRPVTAVFAVRFDWNLTDRGVIGGGGGGGTEGIHRGKGVGEGPNRWSPLDKVLEKMAK